MINLISVNTMSLAGVGAESISALGGYGIRQRYRADMESAPTVVISIIP